MRPAVNFIDTTILCNLLPVPGRCDQHSEVAAEFQAKVGNNETFILPVTTIIETGNHIRHIPDGRLGRACAEKFVRLLELTINRQTPWTLHEFQWEHSFLSSLIEGAGTGITLVEHAVAGLGCGDLCIICERNAYIARTTLTNVLIWTKDRQLASHS